MSEKFAFLTSTRFWAMIIGAVSLYLANKGIIGQAETTLIVTILGGFIGVKTLDRTVDTLSNAEPKEENSSMVD